MSRPGPALCYHHPRGVPGEVTSASRASGDGVQVGDRDVGPARGLGQGAVEQLQVAERQVRSASLFARVADELPGDPVTSRPQLALRDLQLLDGALAEAARWADVPVTDLDTVPR